MRCERLRKQYFWIYVLNYATVTAASKANVSDAPFSPVIVNVKSPSPSFKDLAFYGILNKIVKEIIKKEYHIMIDIEVLKLEIVERLKPLNPDKVILFGSYAYGTPTEESDIDLFLVKDLAVTEARNYRLSARKELRELIRKHDIGFDIITSSNSFLNSRDDYFYKTDILENGKVLYAK